jgi:hypothetical protein
VRRSPTNKSFDDETRSPKHGKSATQPPGFRVWSAIQQMNGNNDSLPAAAARRNEDGPDELIKKLAMNMAAPLAGQSNPAAPGGQGCGGKQRARPGLTRCFGWGFGRAVPDQRVAQVRATQRRAFGCAFQEDRSSRRKSAHSSPSSSDRHSRHKVLAFLVRVMARNGRRTGEDFAGQNAATLFLLADNENPTQEAFVPACCVRRADFLKVGSLVMGLARTVTGAGCKPAAAVSMAGFAYRTSSLQVSALFGRAGVAGCDSAQRTRFVGSVRRSDGYGKQHERNGRDKARSEVRAGRLFFSPSSVTSCRVAPLLHHSVTPFLTRFSATFPAVFLCMGWRPVTSPRKRSSRKKLTWIRTIIKES